MSIRLQDADQADFFAKSVRFLDNFSAGTRGAASAEHFLRTGQYAVIFLHRQHSLQPFSRHYSHSTNPFLDLLDVVPEDPKGKGRDTSNHSLFPPIPAVGTTASRPVSRSPSAIENGLPAGYDSRQQQIVVRAPHREPMLALLKAYKLVKSMRILLSIPYVSVDEYLFYLRGISRVLEGVRDPQGRSAGQRTMYYLAAAVSDFFIPRQRMVRSLCTEHGSLLTAWSKVGTQDSVRQRIPHHRNGSSTEGTQNDGTRVEQARLHRILQGPFTRNLLRSYSND